MKPSQPVSEGIKQIYKRAREAVALEPRYHDLPRAYVQRKLLDITEQHMWIVEMDMLDEDGNRLGEFESAKERYRLAMDYHLGLQ